jgi:hypothetical protein
MSDADLPEWLSTRVSDDIHKDPSQLDIARVMYDSDRAFWCLTKLRARLDGCSRGTVQNRLDGMEAADAIRSEKIAGAMLWWLNDPRSNWPIPPDYDPELNSETTIQDLRGRFDVSIVAWAVALAVISPAVVLIGVFEGTVGYPLPLAANEVIAYGLFGSMTSYFMLLMAGVIYFADLDGARDSLQAWLDDSD